MPFYAVFYDDMRTDADRLLINSPMTETLILLTPKGSTTLHLYSQSTTALNGLGPLPWTQPQCVNRRQGKTRRLTDGNSGE